MACGRIVPVLAETQRLAAVFSVVSLDVSMKHFGIEEMACLEWSGRMVPPENPAAKRTRDRGL